MKLRLPKLKSFIIFVLIIIAVFAIFVFSINAYVKSRTEGKIISPDKISPDNKYDCILILGCGVYDDGTPSPMLHDRLRRGIELYKSGVAPKIIMSGDHGTKDYDEVNAMRDYALECGVPEEDVFMDHAGFSTYESMYRARDVFGVSKMIVVTQKYHLYRSLYIAGKLGIEATGVHSDYRAYAGQMMFDVREVLARCKDFVKCIYEPEPTFLGDPVPVSGDGRASLG